MTSEHQLSEREQAQLSERQQAQLSERQQAQRALDKVRRRVAAIGFFVVADHGVIGLIIAAHVINGQGRHGDAIGLVVMSAIVATVSYVIIRLILARRLFSPPWMLLALAPAVVGAFWIR